jgi:single-stranded-DNA-specific exonuclease
VLAARGITDANDLHYTLSNMLPVSSLTYAFDMAERLAQAVVNGERIMIVADYDTDGATACAIMVRALRGFGGVVDWDVPNREKDGYGLTRGIVERVARKNPDIIITVDNGIASVDGVDAANERGIEVLVTDHHLPGDELPKASCIVDPSQPGCTFQSKALAGCGVAFYVMAALQKTLMDMDYFKTRPMFNVKSLVDLVALGTIADVVKLDTNNRILVNAGLEKIRSGNGFHGINEILKVAQREPTQVTAWDLGYMVGPRLNAAGRMDDMSMGINCLLENDPVAAAERAAKLQAINQERKETEAAIKDKAFDMLDLDHLDYSDKYSVVLYDKSWHKGVIGIVASRVKDRTNRPTLIFAPGKPGEMNASGRSIPNLHLRDCLDLVSKRHDDIIVRFGGHSMAAGVTIHDDKLEAFTNAFEAAARSLMTPDMLEEVIETDGPLVPNEITIEVAEYFRNQIWGQGFQPPTFQGIFKIESQQVVSEKHLKLLVSQNGKSWPAIMFFQTEMMPDTIQASYTLDVNEYRGNKSIQLMIQKWFSINPPEIKEKMSSTEFYKTEEGFCF